VTPPTFLRVTKSIGYTDESVIRIEPADAVSAGIRWGAIGAEMVPLFEEHSERIRRRYSLNEWAQLDPLEKAMMIAIRRIDTSMRNLQAEAETRAAKAKAKK
jgi:hypothetical protein